MNEVNKVVILGSSAGGLEALSDFLSSVPLSDEISYVVAQHLAPDTTSLLTDLLSRQTKLRVVVAPQQFYPEPGSVFIVPPNNDIEYAKGEFILLTPEQKIGPKPSINRLLKSIAIELEAIDEKAKKPIFCGIILSGTGTDGALGLTALKAAGGITAAQEPSSAKYNGMPMAAIHARAADIVAPPESLGGKISEILDKQTVEEADTQHESMAYYKIISLVKEITNIDLTNYKPSTVERRMLRRRDAVKVKNLEEYLSYVRKYTTEADNLIQEVLIPVTEFFRDYDYFKALRVKVTEALKNKEIGQEGVLRVWCAGCATGEEAYTLAIMLEELLLESERPVRYQIFATDLDDNALLKARSGIYRLSAIEKIPLQYQKRYFEIIGGDVKIRQDLRDRITFTQHNLVQDPPFGRIDLVSCRNLLIYFNTILQATAFDTFHYSLTPSGILFLGRAESLVDPDQFNEFDRKHKIFVKNDRYQIKRNFSHFRFLGVDARLQKDTRSKQEQERYLIDDMQILQQLFGDKFILLNQEMGVRYVGRELPFDLKIKKGIYADDVSDILPDELLPELKVLVIKAKRTNEPSTPIWVTLPQKNGVVKVQLILFPIKHTITGGDLRKSDFVVVFNDVTDIISRSGAPELSPDEVSIVGDLQLELALARQLLQSTVEELEASNEELQAINEEMQSSNEELQSTNEELQTTNEELQSTNEELLTVNDEIVEKNIQLAILTDDLSLLKKHIDFEYIVLSQSGDIISHFLSGDLLASVEGRANIRDTAISNVVDLSAKSKSQVQISLRDVEYIVDAEWHESTGEYRNVVFLQFRKES